ncbi:MAG: CehA/McbA family metallohydrolase [Deltaproteobacteria bacterium]|nr:CehA/McbA family metallohydrolase [Deltaproteobacteria bacterium]
MGNHLFEYTGNVHIHTGYSDGSKTVAEIARDAALANLDFIIINDHDYMAKSLHVEDEGHYGGLLVLMGLELGGRFHHYLAFGLREMVHGKGAGPQSVIDRVNQKGGFGFLAHPFEQGMSFRENRIAYTWNDLSVTGYTGICIWNFSSRWKERVKTPLHGLFFLLFKSRTLKGPSQQTLRFWDSACEKRRVVAIGGSDAHGGLFRWGPLRFTPLSYRDGFLSINIHLLLDRPLSKDPTYAKKQVYEAMKEGRLHIAHDRLASSREFRFSYVTERGGTLEMGEERTYRPGTVVVETPQKGEIRLLRNGIVVARAMGWGFSHAVRQPGVYRVEVYRRVPIFGHRPWIFSNPIYLR